MPYKRKYRIVADSYNGYEVQYKVRFLPIWIQCSRVISNESFCVNTFSKIEDCDLFIKEVEEGLHKRFTTKVVKTY